MGRSVFSKNDSKYKFSSNCEIPTRKSNNVCAQAPRALNENIRNVSKQIFLNGITCPTYAWLMRTGKLGNEKAEPTLGEKFRMEE